MRRLLNTVYVTNEQSYLYLDGENIVCKVDNEIKNTFEKDIIVCPGLNLLEMEEEKSVKKTAISVYFKEEDLNLLKAISQIKNTTVNKTIMNILDTTIETTRGNLPKDFDVNKKAKEYDKRNKNKGNRRK